MPTSFRLIMGTIFFSLDGVMLRPKYNISKEDGIKPTEKVLKENENILEVSRNDPVKGNDVACGGND
ncbi:hypothetical protein Scep_015074 [Stephania cephalantha]|uniref:Uncharacterized protein n=1 Tax=Stephania cephalantha TaxID=152367 RepID=A0AAP0J4F9_9MAGN